MHFCSHDSKITRPGQFLSHKTYQCIFTQQEIILFHAVYHQCHAIYQSQCLIFSSANYVRTPKLKSPVFPGSKKPGEKMKRSIISPHSSLRFLHYPALKQGPWTPGSIMKQCSSVLCSWAALVSLTWITSELSARTPFPVNEEKSPLSQCDSSLLI